MKAVRPLFLALAVALLCATAFADVHTDYDHHVNFSQFHT